jgi:hypothetical protein
LSLFQRRVIGVVDGGDVQPIEQVEPAAEGRVVLEVIPDGTDQHGIERGPVDLRVVPDANRALHAQPFQRGHQVKVVRMDGRKLPGRSDGKSKIGNTHGKHLQRLRWAPLDLVGGRRAERGGLTSVAAPLGADAPAQQLRRVTGREYRSNDLRVSMWRESCACTP